MSPTRKWPCQLGVTAYVSYETIMSKDAGELQLDCYQPENLREAIMGPRLYGRSRQCGRPVGAQCSMGLGRNPLINGLIQHTYK